MSEPYNIELLKKRDPSALDRLVRGESDQVFRCVSRFIRESDEARSLTQETFLQAIKNITSFRGESKISTWLCSIAINLARAALRKRRRYDVLDEEEMDRLQPSFTLFGSMRDEPSVWNPEKVIERNERVELVRTAIDRLPDDYREVVILRDMEELNTAEVARVLGISEGAVRVRLHRARQALRALLDRTLGS